jgi:hypothetical protein
MGDRQQQYPAMLARELLKAGFDHPPVRLATVITLKRSEQELQLQHYHQELACIEKGNTPKYFVLFIYSARQSIKSSNLVCTHKVKCNN